MELTTYSLVVHFMFLSTIFKFFCCLIKSLLSAGLYRYLRVLLTDLILDRSTISVLATFNGC